MFCLVANDISCWWCVLNIFDVVELSVCSGVAHPILIRVAPTGNAFFPLRKRSPIYDSLALVTTFLIFCIQCVRYHWVSVMFEEDSVWCHWGDNVLLFCFELSCYKVGCVQVYLKWRDWYRLVVSLWLNDWWRCMEHWDIGWIQLLLRRRPYNVLRSLR